ncbi:MAG: DUF2635 domain-containing protein [Planctomycetota bacterium]
MEQSTRTHLHLKPRAGFQVSDPDAGDRLPVEGRRVRRSGYWLRRLRDGDVVEITTERSSDEQAEQPIRAKRAPKS